MQPESCWEVLNGAGVDGGGRFSSFFLLFSPILLGQEQTTAIYWELATPSAPAPFRTSRTYLGRIPGMSHDPIWFAGTKIYKHQWPEPRSNMSTK